MKITATLTAAAALLTASTDAQINDAPLILGGTVVPTGTKTYTVNLRSTATGTSFCGGSLITPKHVLTAAHCTARTISYVAVGTHFNSGSADGERIAVTKITKHPQNVAVGWKNDFLILELATASKYPPIPLTSADGSDFVVGANTTVIGWGTTTSGGVASRELLSVDVAIVSNPVCAPAVANVAPVDATMLCAGGLRNQDSCQGDSGGPLVIKKNGADVLTGVVSWGDRCGLVGKPGVYARVSSTLAWIQSVAPGVTIV